MIRKYKEFYPEISENAFIAENAAVIGNVKIADGVGVWYSAVIRGDEGKIEIGKNSNIQDNATVHVTDGFDCKIGENVTVGHNAIIHGCTVGNNTLVGMGACIMNGAEIGNDCIIAAGALVTEKTVIPDGKMAVGVPAKVIKDITDSHKSAILKNAMNYSELAGEYKKMQEET